PPFSSASVWYGISSSAKARARAWRSRSSVDRPYIRAPPARLTERSVYVSIGGMPMVSPAMRTVLPGTADAVVVGGGTVGAWGAYFLRQAGRPRGRGGPDAGRSPGGGPAGPLVPGLLPPPARRAGHGLRVRAAGL